MPLMFVLCTFTTKDLSKELGAKLKVHVSSIRTSYIGGASGIMSRGYVKGEGCKTREERKRYTTTSD